VYGINAITYYPKYQQLAMDVNYGTGSILLAGIYLDSITMLKTYALESNGTSVMEAGNYASYANEKEAGGSFTLTQIDTMKKTVSGSFHFTGYNTIEAEDKSIVDGDFTNLSFTVDTSAYNGTKGSYTMTGANISHRLTKDIFAQITCMNTDGTDKILEVRLNSMIGNPYLSFRIPLDNGKGVFSILPDVPPYSYCFNNNLVSKYINQDYNNAYYPTSGTITLTTLDTVAKKLDAQFAITMADTTSRHETVTLTDGILHLEHWNEFK
jgi:hypothetical protein